MKSIILLSACLALPAAAHAACEDYFPRWAKQLAEGRDFDDAHAVCKPWPANSTLTLAAMAYPRPRPTDADADADGDTERVDDLLLLVADTTSGAVIAHLMQPSAIHYDAEGFSELTFDTARYQVTPDKRAFGIRIRTTTPRPDEGGATALNLYLLEGATLRPILRQLVVDRWQREAASACVATWHKMTRAIGIGAPGEAGYAALLVAEQAKDTEMTDEGEKCVEKDGPVRRASYTLNYRGGQYAVPKELSNQQ